ncbi:NAD-glutamate dehydrogenase [Kocuria rhizophila]|nr:NAD-glutamate dehydrogenase [Kocuria rhizophila]
MGYDHKAMGITAAVRGSPVKRFLRAQHGPVRGVHRGGRGGMSGDVFGDGMLLSEHIHLIAAFDRRDVLDPARTPRPPTRSVSGCSTRGARVAGFDRSVISEGGGVYSRRETPSRSPRRCARRWAWSGVESLSPQELARRILLAPADLLYNGGIGTYVKASSETHRRGRGQGQRRHPRRRRGPARQGDRRGRQPRRRPARAHRPR